MALMGCCLMNTVKVAYSNYSCEIWTYRENWLRLQCFWLVCARGLVRILPGTPTILIEVLRDFRQSLRANVGFVLWNLPRQLSSTCFNLTFIIALLSVGDEMFTMTSGYNLSDIRNKKWPHFERIRFGFLRTKWNGPSDLQRMEERG
jgi:hypothetical protein